MNKFYCIATPLITDKEIKANTFIVNPHLKTQGHLMRVKYRVEFSFVTSNCIALSKFWIHFPGNLNSFHLMINAALFEIIHVFLARTILVIQQIFK